MPQNAGLNGNHADQKLLPHPHLFQLVLITDGLGCGRVDGKKESKLTWAIVHLVIQGCLGLWTGAQGEIADIWLANSDPNSSVSLTTRGGEKNRDLQN